jgi:membrane protein YdbS with pleckstrin-like domain
MKEKTKLIFLQVFATKIGWLFICLIAGAVFGACSTNSTIVSNGKVWCNYAMIVCFIYPAILVFVMFRYAIKNTAISIHEWFKNRKK